MKHTNPTNILRISFLTLWNTRLFSWINIWIVTFFLQLLQNSDPSQMKMTKQAFLIDFLISNFYVLKLGNTNKKNWRGHIDWKSKLKKINCFHWPGGSLWLFKLCEKMWLTFCMANIFMATSFHQCLSVKTCFETKFCQTFPYKIYLFIVWKVLAQSTTFVIYCG